MEEENSCVGEDATGDQNRAGPCFAGQTPEQLSGRKIRSQSASIAAQGIFRKELSCHLRQWPRDRYVRRNAQR